MSCSCRIVFDKQHLNCKIGFLSSDKKAFHKDFWSINPFLGVWIDSLCAFFGSPGCQWECLQGQIWGNGQWGVLGVFEDIGPNIVPIEETYSWLIANRKVVIRNLVGSMEGLEHFEFLRLIVWRIWMENFPRNLTQIPKGCFGKCISFRLFCNFWIRVSMSNFWGGSLSELFQMTWQAYRNKTQECDMRQAHLGHCFLMCCWSYQFQDILMARMAAYWGQLCSK